MTYKQWLNEIQSLTWSDYCKLGADEKEVLRADYEEYVNSRYGVYTNEND